METSRTATARNAGMRQTTPQKDTPQQTATRKGSMHKDSTHTAHIPRKPAKRGTHGPTRRNPSAPSSRALARRMVRLVGPLWPVEYRAIACGVTQHLVSVAAVVCASIGILRAAGMPNGLPHASGPSSAPGLQNPRPTPDPSVWLGWAIAAALLLLVRGLFSYGEQLSNHQMAFSTLRDIRTSVFDQMRRLAPAKLEGAGRGNLVTVLTQDIELLEIFYAHTLSPLAIAALCSLVCAVAAAFVHPLLGLLALVSYALTGIGLPLLFASPTAREAHRERERQGALRSRFLESLDARRLIRDFGARRHIDRELADSADRMIAARIRAQRLTSANSLSADALMLLAVASFALLTLRLGVSGSVSPAAALVCLAGFATSFPPVLSVARLDSGLQPTFAAARRVFALIDETPAVQEVADGQGQRLTGFRSLEARNLAFSYPVADSPDAQSDRQPGPVLSGLDLTIRPGDVIGIEGPNGAGKTTLLDVLLRFRDRTGGSLSLDGIPIERIETTSLRRLETLAAQSTFVFSDTLTRNIALARPSASLAEVEEVAHRACLGEVIDQLPGGLDHVLVRHGRELSEGQRQRIAVARALLSDASLILLDEPTSNMDALLEGRILRSLLSAQGLGHQGDRHGSVHNSVLGSQHRDVRVSQHKDVCAKQHGSLSPRAYLIVTHWPTVLRRIHETPGGRVFTLRDGSLHAQ